MALDADVIVDRRRMRRSLAVWRALALIAVAVAVGALIGVSSRRSSALLPLPEIARVPITGTITVNRKQLQLIDDLRTNPRVRAVILAIDSPGGTTVGGERLYRAVRLLASEKPVVAQIGTLGASAAYLTAIAADHIVADYTSLTGSVGVLSEFPNVSDLLGKLGVKVGKIQSGVLKAEPDPFQPVPAAAVTVFQSVIDDSFAWFIGLVRERRHLTPEQAATIADGRVVSGHQALGLGLVDEIGGEEAAKAWLVTARGIDPTFPIRTFDVSTSTPFGIRMADRAADRLLSAIGIPVPTAVDGRTGSLDGLLSLWQGPGSRADTGD